jgi:sigma-B regulation protein RsbU (phosphoserine phosphatase)
MEKKRLQLIGGGLLFALYFAAAAANSYQTFVVQRQVNDAGWFGAWKEQRLFVRMVVVGGPAEGLLRVGDEIVALNGQDIREVVKSTPFFNRLEPGGAYTATVRREGQLQDIGLRAVAGLRTGNLFRLGLMLLFLITGFLVFLLKPFDKQAFLLALMFAAITGVPFYSLNGPGWVLAILGFVGTLSHAILYPVFLHFFLVFPEPSPLLRRWPKLTRYLYVPGVLTALPVYVTYRLLRPFAPPQLLAGITPTVRYLYYVHTAFVLLYFAAGLVSLVANYRQAGVLARRKMRLVMVGSLAGFVPLLALIALETLGFDEATHWWMLWVDAATGIGLMLVPLTYAYAIIRHRVIPISLIIRQGVRYLLVSRGFVIIEAIIIFAVLSFLLTGGRVEWIDRFGPRADTLVAVVATALAVWLLRKLNRRVMPLIDRRFFREAYDAQQILAELGQAIRRVTSVEQLLELVVTKIQDALHPQTVAVFLREEQTGDYACAISSRHLSDGRVRASLRESDAGESLSSRLVLARDSFLVERLRESHEPLEVGLIGPEERARTLSTADAGEAVARERERLIIEETAAELLLPIATKEELLGMLILGPRLGDLPFSREDKQLLSALALQMAFAIENARLIQRKVEEERLRRELEMATEVQRRIFPESPPEVAMLELAGSCQPARGVGGDYYDFLVLEDEQVGVAVADVAGKGISAALLMSIVQASLRSQAQMARGHLTELVSSMNRLLNRSTGSHSYATFFYAQFDQHSRALTYVNAGHNPPMLWRARPAASLTENPSWAGDAGDVEDEPPLGEVRGGIGTATNGLARLETLTTGGPVIGLFESFTYEQETIQMQRGDTLIAYTDGLSEALNPEGEEFGEEKLGRLLVANAHLPAVELSEVIAASVREWCRDAPQHDDLTLVVMKVK